MRKMISIAVTMALIFGSFAGAYAAPTMPTDISGTKYETAVGVLIENGVISGYPDGKYYPENTITRAEACKLVVSALGGTVTVGELSGFPDMAGASWAEAYVAYAVKAGIVVGYTDGKFMPAAVVSQNELIMMLVRALGYTNSSLGGSWPANYIEKAAALGITAGTGFGDAKYANRGIAALLTYNAFFRTDKLAVVISKTEPSTGSFNMLTVLIKDGTETVLNVSKNVQSFKQLSSGDFIGYSTDAAGTVNRIIKKDSIYAYNKSFTESTAYNGIAVASDATVFTFGMKTDFTASKATFTQTGSDYGINSLVLMRNAATPAYYLLENGKITAMIVPTDVGFAGRAYGMILETSKASNIDSKAVDALQFLIGTANIQILTDGNSAIPLKADFLSGEAYELSLKNGVATNIATATGITPLKKNSAFVELTSNYMKITDKASDYIIVEDGSGLMAIEITANTVIYVVNYDNTTPESYKAGTTSSIKAGAYVRAFDVTDDKSASANILVIGKYANART